MPRARKAKPVPRVKVKRRGWPRKHYKRRSTKFKAPDETGTAVIADGTICWTLPRKLVSPNALKTGLARHGDTKAWERTFLTCRILASDGSLGPCLKERLKLEVVRLCPQEQWFLDRTNLAFSVKGLEDSLVRLEYMVDDNERWLDGPYVTQAVSEDGKYWTLVKLSRIDTP